MKMRSLVIGMLLASALLLSACGGEEEVVVETEVVTETETETEEAPKYVTNEDAPKGKVVSELTGEFIDEKLANQRPIAVMIDNEKVALPHYGVTKADIVYEMVNSEHNDRVTRLMALVKDWVFLCLAYTAITAGRVRYPWLLLFLFAAPLAAVGYEHTVLLTAGKLPSAVFYTLLADYLLFLGGIFLTLAIRVHPRGEYHPTWGDRPDGRKIRTLAPMAQITSYFQVERNTCSNLFEESFEITHIERYIRQKRREGFTDFGITHVLLAAYVRGVAKFPQINRFVSGQKIYSRGNDIQYCMVVKKEMTVESPDTSIKVHLTPYDTATDVYRKLNAAVEEVKATQELDSSLDSLIMTLNLIPSVVLKFFVWLLKALDYFGQLPKFLLELSPFHGSLFFTSMGSLGIPPIFHHLYDFGNLPVFGAFGCKRKTIQIQEDGSVVQRKYVDCKFTLDERICDGYYYAAFFKHYKRILAHPEILDNPPEEVIPDID